MKKPKTLLCLSLATLLGTTLLSSCNTTNENGVGYVTIETNPGVELVVNEDNIVIAVNGLNDDGKLLISGEEIEGLTIENATSKILELTEKLGFTVSGTIDEEKQEIKITVSASTKTLKENLTKVVKEEAEKVVDYLELDAIVAKIEEKTRNHFEEILGEYYPHLTEEQIDNLTVEELYGYMEGIVEEKAQFASVQLEEYYQQLKESEFKFKYKEEIAAKLSEVGGVLDTATITMYNTAVSSLKELIEKLHDVQIKQFIDPDSAYAKAVAAVNDQKSQVIELRVKIGSTEGEVESTVVEALNGAEKLLDELKESLDTLAASGKAMIDNAISAVEGVLEQLESWEKELPLFSKIDFNAELGEAEKIINDSKNQLFAKFEETVSKEDIEKIKTEITERKEELKEKVAAAKAEAKNTNK